MRIMFVANIPKVFLLGNSIRIFFFFEKERGIEENPIGSKESSEI